MKYTFLENKFDSKYNKYKLFEYDQFDDEDDDEDDDIENIDQEKIEQMSYICDDIKQLFDILFYKNISLEKIEKYIKYNKRLLNKIYHNKTPLTWACRQERYDIAKLLLSHGADPNIQDKYGYTPLIEACYNGNIDIVKLLLENDADPNMQDKEGYTPLRLACYISYISSTDIVKLLLSHGANPNIQDKVGDTPLMFACYNGNIDIIKLLLSQDANPNIQDKEGRTPLIEACSRGIIDIVKLLLSQDANPNIQDKEGRTPLIEACYRDYFDIVKLLLSHGVDLNIQDHQKRTGLWYACFSGCIDIVKLLLEYGANPSELIAQVNDGETLLIRACKKDDFETAKLLLEYGANPNETTEFENTALLCAFRNNNLELVKLLLSHGADIYYYLISSDIVRYKNYNNTLDLLLQNSSKPTIQKSCYKFCDYLINEPGDLLYKKLYTLEKLLDYGAKISSNIFYNLVIKAFDIYTDHLYSDDYSLSNYYGLLKKILDDVNISEISISKKGDKAIGWLIEILIHKNLDGNFNYIKELLNLMSNVDVNLPQDETLLTYTLRFSNLPYGYELVKLLLKHGADPNKKNKKGFTPLGIALKIGNIKIIKLLSKDGIDTNNLTGQYALISALRNENFKLAKQLIKDNIDINVEYIDRYHGRISPFSLILRISEDKIRLPLLKLIIEHGLDTNLHDILVSITRSKLEQKDKESIIRLLLKKGADINKSNCLRFSLFDKDIEMFKFLLKNGADINRTNFDGDTILLEVVRDKYNARFDDSTLELLLKHKIDVNKRNNKLETALYWSITNNNDDYTKLLLEHGADPNIHIMKGDTVLHIAVRNKNIELIKLLLEHDADPSIKNNSGKSPLDIAKTKEIRTLLQKKSK